MFLLDCAVAAPRQSWYDHRNAGHHHHWVALAKVSVMSILSRDTDLAAECVHIDLMRRAPVWRKLELVAQLNELARALALSGLRQRYPDASPEELRRRLADLLLGPELAAAAYGPLELVAPEPLDAE